MQQQPLEHHSRQPAVRQESLAGLAGLIGMLAALIGVWMLVGPSDGRLTIAIPGLFDQTWDATDLVGTWATPLLIVGGLLGAAGFGWIAWTSRSVGRGAAGLVGLVLAAIGLVVALAGAVRLI